MNEPRGFEELLDVLVRRAVREEMAQVIDVVRELVAASSRPEPKSYSVDDAALMLGDVSARTVRRLIDSGDLAATYVGSRVVVPAPAIEEYLHQQLHQPSRTKSGAE